jgi:peptidyl-tRNA hydrolase
LYVIVRSDLDPIGYQIPQAGHAITQFIFDHFDIAKNWHETSDYLVVLNIDNEEKLIELLNKANELNIKSSAYREQDLDMQYTAIALEPGIKTKKLCQNLKLALSYLNK